ncbi:MAG: VCBS repeat-containing protein [Desulfuromonadales bacterium]
MNRHCTFYLTTVMLLLITLPAQAERLACTATFSSATGAINIDAVDVGSKRYVVKLALVTGASTMRFRLESATLTSNHECYDAASVTATTLTIPDIAAADSFFNATLTLVTGNGPTQIDLATTSPASMLFDLTASAKNPRLVPDAGLRVEKAGIPFATVNSSSGVTYLGYISAVDGSEAFQSSTDGLTFSNPTPLTLNNRSVDSRRTRLTDGTWRLYMMNQNTGVMTSYFSSDGNVFGPSLESGTRYSATADDKLSGATPYTGVYDFYYAGDGALILVYLGDLMGKNNLRMAKSIDNGVTFTWVKGNVLGDDNTGYAFVDNKTIRLADGRTRMFTMRSGQLQSFVTSDGYTWSREVGTRISYRDFTSVGLTLYSLNDPVPVFDKNSNLKVYVAAATAANANTAGNTNWAIVSTTWNENVGSGVLGVNGSCGTSNSQSFTVAPASNLCTIGASSTVTGSGPWSWTCNGINGGSNASCSASLSTLTPSITWRHQGDGKAYGMTTNGSTVTGGAQFWQETNPAWSIVGQGDFDGDGVRDLVWWNNGTGQVYIMLMSGSTAVKSGALLYTEPDTHWRIAATGDISGDGKSDLIWWNNSTGQVYAMLLNGTAVAGGGLIYTEANTNWKIVAAADFNGDGKVELLWWNSSTGQTAIGQTNGTSASSANLIWTEPNTDWRIAGAGDLDGDGKADIIWHNRTTGQVYGMQTNGSSVTNGAMMYTEPNTQWEIVSVGNYNSDSKADLLWWNQQTGQVYVMPMNGLAVASGGALLYTEPDLTWHIQGETEWRDMTYGRGVTTTTK